MLRAFTRNMSKRCYWTNDMPQDVSKTITRYESPSNLVTVLYNQNELLHLLERQNVEQLKHLKLINEQLSLLISKQ